MRHVSTTTCAEQIGSPDVQVDLYYGQSSLETLKSLPEGCVDTVCTSPPYWQQREYNGVDTLWGDGWSGQLGQEPTPEEYAAHLVEIFREIRRVLKDTGTVWLNLGDSYQSHSAKDTSNNGGFQGQRMRDDVDTHTAYVASMGKPKVAKDTDLIGIPWVVAFALRADGWFLRQDIIWAKGVSGEANAKGYHGNPMPEGVKSRCTKAHEYVFLLSKQKDYYFDSDAIQDDAHNEKKRNRRSVWTVNTVSYRGGHYATWPLKLVTPMVLAGAPPGGTVLDPFSGTATTGEACVQHGRNYIGLDLSEDYLTLAKQRLRI